MRIDDSIYLLLITVVKGLRYIFFEKKYGVLRCLIMFNP